MRQIVKSIPNTITLLNLLSGMMATSFAFEGKIEMALIFIFAAAIFDFFDGFAARLLKAYSPLGKDLDSLADLISFGVAPSAMLYMVSACNYFAFVIAAFSALRLAKFNNDTRQTTTFIGLPTPANAILISSATYLSIQLGALTHIYQMVFTSYIGSSVTAAVLSILLVSEIPMFSLKFKSYGFRDNIVVYSFLLLSLIGLFILKIWALPLIIVAYILLSIALMLCCKRQ